MTHYVYYKFEPDYLTDEVFAHFKETFKKMVVEIDGVSDVEVIMNALPSEVGLDLMVKMTIDNPEVLPVYRAHPLHQGIIKYGEGHVKGWYPFDCE